MSPIRCRECAATGLPHREHCAPEELAALRALRVEDSHRQARMGAMDEQSIQIGPYRLTRDQIAELLNNGDGVNIWLWREAAASVALDHDSRARTVSLEDLTPEQLEKWETRQGQPETD